MDRMTAELDAVAGRLKDVLHIDPELDAKIEDRILAKVNQKRVQKYEVAPQWRGALKLALAATLLTAVLGMVFLTPGMRAPSRNSNDRRASLRDSRSIAKDLPVVGSFAKLKELATKASKSGGRYRYPAYRMAEAPLLRADVQSLNYFSADPIEAYAPNSDAVGFDDSVASKSLSSSGYSTTNVQVKGVDEADIVKTDGTNIYQVNGERIVIAQANPSDQMRVLSEIKYNDEDFYPVELYVDAKFLTVVGRSSRDLGKAPVPKFPASIPAPPEERRGSVAKVIAYDLSDKENPRKVREVELDGEYVSSRKIGSALYLVANKYVDVGRMLQETTETANLDFFKPAYRDSARGKGFTPLDYSQIRYFPNAVELNYLMVTGFDLEKPDEKVSVSTYLGAGQNVYASPENLYVAATIPKETEGTSTVEPQPSLSPRFVPGPAATRLYRFALDSGRFFYQAKGEVPGMLLNQFSMDEHAGYFRVATTKGEVWGQGEAAARNNVYTLNKKMAITGRLENVAPGESIYSVRFMGNRAYMVTFRQTDPLFVVGLDDPSAPKILGELKIPGYSSYLHSYDENHLIGFGVDQGMSMNMKIAMFDVSNVKHPVEKFKTIIGDWGSDSELLRNHKALLFDKAKDLMAFPVTVNSAGGQNGDRGFQGAYVYKITLDKGMELKGKITHLPEGAAGIHGKPDELIERVLYIDDTLYTVSKGIIKANDITDLHEKNRLVL